MAKEQVNVPEPAAKPLFSNTLTVWIGIITSITTIVLTIYTTSNKVRLDQLETDFKDRSAKVEESKERVERYKWVYSLYSDLNNTDVRKKNFTVGLITLALNDQESKKLFSALQTSNDTLLQGVGQSGLKALKAIANNDIAVLVSKIDTSNYNERVKAVGKLESDYIASPPAITMVLNLYNPDNIVTLSPDGIINGLYFLNRTNPKAWNQQQIKQGQDVTDQIKTLNPGPNTLKELAKFNKILTQAAKGQ
ncbi:hypothetical protein SAMN05216464_12245 [Mucilaginibacter pineti]|uniref:Uncharacterized protein n=1 Tax=Mucilaginibacter pineti TaxID=1391627 RepID=A0A1G7MQY1_9SPHI|nr:hypothetical protein [Mucilaginibacter pineti]SDF63480.1 hypothetical protein SAMN05216464_12245 [Mucilaginibacter pineti]